jgi:cell division protein FtsB
MQLFSHKIIVALAGIVVLFILVSLAQEMNRRIQIQREVALLDQEVRGLDKEIAEMENLNEYFRSNAFQERMAREKMNYRAPGEEVVLIPEVLGEQDVVGGNIVDSKSTSVPERWWRIFFIETLTGSEAPIQ